MRTVLYSFAKSAPRIGAVRGLLAALHYVSSIRLAKTSEGSSNTESEWFIEAEDSSACVSRGYSDIPLPLPQQPILQCRVRMTIPYVAETDSALSALPVEYLAIIPELHSRFEIGERRTQDAETENLASAVTQAIAGLCGGVLVEVNEADQRVGTILSVPKPDGDLINFWLERNVSRMIDPAVLWDRVIENLINQPLSPSTVRTVGCMRMLFGDPEPLFQGLAIDYAQKHQLSPQQTEDLKRKVRQFFEQ